jgi:hypothetical protein
MMPQMSALRRAWAGFVRDLCEDFVEIAAIQETIGDPLRPVETP